MYRREFVSKLSLFAGVLFSGFISCGTKSPHILLRSSWQTINIGDIAHTPGMLNLFERYLPQVKVTLWPSSIADGAEEMILRRFPDLHIIKNEADIQKAFTECDFFFHGSGPFVVGRRELIRWKNETGKPFGIYGVSFSGKRSDVNVSIKGARFIYFRDSKSLALARKTGIESPVMDFCPDAAFATDVRNDPAAIRFLNKNNLQEGKFLCCIPRLRYTPNWLIPVKNRPLNPEKHTRNEKMKEHDHLQLRQAIIELTRQTDMKVLICPEDVTQVKIGKEMLYDPLPDDVKSKVVWKNSYWLTDEALSTYVRSSGLFGNEMHSPIMCLGNGIPAIVCRSEEQTTKGYMWRDIGLGDWLFDLDNEEDVKKIVPAVLSLVTDQVGTKEKVTRAQKFVLHRQRESMEEIGQILRINKD